MNEVYFIQSESGDEYKLQITSEHSGLIAPKLLDCLNAEGIEVFEIGLGRAKGTLPTSPHVLARIEEIVAEVFLSHPNAVISFFCDFITAIPSMNRKRKMTVQQYRSQLFSYMFDRFIRRHHLDGIYNKVVIVQGVAESYYFHVITRQEHLRFADMIAEGHHQDFDK